MKPRVEAKAFFDEFHRRYRSPEKFVQTFRMKLRENGITQGAVARRAGFDPGHVSRWVGEKASVTPQLGTMVILDEALEQLINRSQEG